MELKWLSAEQVKRKFRDRTAQDIIASAEQRTNPLVGFTEFKVFM